MTPFPLGRPVLGLCMTVLAACAPPAAVVPPAGTSVVQAAATPLDGARQMVLVADRPRVLSSWLAFEVKAGIYPDRLDGEQTARLRENMSRFGPTDGTLIEVDVDHGYEPLQDGGCLGRFLADRAKE